MKLAVLSDVHADRDALTEALAAIDRLGCEAIVCAGDLVDYGLFPNETLALLRAREIPCIRGNHDRWAVGRSRANSSEATSATKLQDASGEDLVAENLRFLTELPTEWSTVLEGVRVAVRYGTPRSDMEGIDPDHVTIEAARRWLEEAGADVLLVGHTHIAFAATVLGGGLIANPGALLRDPAGAELEIPRPTVGVRDRRGR